MSDETLLDLWRRCVAAGYGWRPGMLAIAGERSARRILESGSGYVIWIAEPTSGEWVEGDCDGLAPDFTDPATLGCLLGMVRRAWGGQHVPMWAAHCDGGWSVWRMAATGWGADAVGGTAEIDGVRQWTSCHGATEAEALLRALLAAKTEGE